MLQKNMLFINVLAAFYKRMKYETICVIFLHQPQKSVLPQGVGKTVPYLGQDGPLTVVAAYSSTTHDLNLFCGQQS